MIKDHIYSSLTKHLVYSPTLGQNLLLRKLTDFILSEKNDNVFVLNGYAGTGKTTIISALVKTLKNFKINSFLLAPTGRAAKVIMSYSHYNAYTIHKKIYRQKSSKDGFGKFIVNFNPNKNTLFIVDEASMIADFNNENSIFGSGNLLFDLIEFVKTGNNCKLILVGDTAQLPPVGLNISPALNKENFKQYGLGAEYFEITEVVRQSKGSGILMNATYLREMLQTGLINIKINIKDFEDVKRISGAELIDSLNESVKMNGFQDVMIICRSNKRANLYNQGIRNQILFRDEEISTGDLLMVVKNNYYWCDDLNIDFIANGDIVEIVRIHKIEELYGFRFAEVTVRFVDYKEVDKKLIIMLDTLTVEAPALPSDKNKELFYTILDDYLDIKQKKKQFQQVKENKYFNALQVKFAYAATCHKAQGGQWKYVYIDQGYLTNEMINKEYVRWLYTAFTRATEKLFLINFKDEFFD